MNSNILTINYLNDSMRIWIMNMSNQKEDENESYDSKEKLRFSKIGYFDLYKFHQILIFWDFEFLDCWMTIACFLVFAQVGMNAFVSTIFSFQWYCGLNHTLLDFLIV